MICFITGALSHRFARIFSTRPDLQEGMYSQTLQGFWPFDPQWDGRCFASAFVAARLMSEAAKVAAMMIADVERVQPRPCDGSGLLELKNIMFSPVCLGVFPPCKIFVCRAGEAKGRVTCGAEQPVCYRCGCSSKAGRHCS